MQKTKLIIVDDHGLLLDSLAQMFNREPNLEVIGVATNGNELLELLTDQQPDIVILDIDMPGMDGIDTTRMLRKKYPALKIIISTMYNTQVFVQLLMQLGVNGYVLKKSKTKELLTAINVVKEGGSFFGQGVPLTFNHQEKIKLTARELQVLRLVAQGLSSAEIADKLNNAVTTVETHRRNMLNKFSAKNMIDLIRIAESMGYLMPGNFGER
ncbi:MAG: response regulator [Flammeovirgaceae bacterium]